MIWQHINSNHKVRKERNRSFLKKISLQKKLINLKRMM